MTQEKAKKKKNLKKLHCNSICDFMPNSCPADFLIFKGKN